MVALTSSGGNKAFHERDILKEALNKYAHIFAWDHWTVYSDSEVAWNRGKDSNGEYPKVQRWPNIQSWVNLPLVLTVWKMSRQQTTWKSRPWIVKCDPSAFFILQRRREVLKFQQVTQNGILLENCKDARKCFHGSLEVMSNAADGTFLDHIEACHDIASQGRCGSRLDRHYHHARYRPEILGRLPQAHFAEVMEEHMELAALLEEMRVSRSQESWRAAEVAAAVVVLVQLVKGVHLQKRRRGDG